jgi:hypothetical protein
LRQFFHDRLKARFLVFRQFGAAETEIADFVIDDLFLLGGKPSVFRWLSGRGICRTAPGSGEFGIERARLGQHVVVGLAPGRYVVEPKQMADDAPSAAGPSRPSPSGPAKSARWAAWFRQ